MALSLVERWRTISDQIETLLASIDVPTRNIQSQANCLEAWIDSLPHGFPIRTKEAAHFTRSTQRAGQILNRLAVRGRIRKTARGHWRTR